MNVRYIHWNIGTWERMPGNIFNHCIEFWPFVAKSSAQDERMPHLPHRNIVFRILNAGWRNKSSLCDRNRQQREIEKTCQRLRPVSACRMKYKLRTYNSMCMWPLQRIDNKSTNSKKKGKTTKTHLPAAFECIAAYAREWENGATKLRKIISFCGVCCAAFFFRCIRSEKR